MATLDVAENEVGWRPAIISVKWEGMGGRGREEKTSRQGVSFQLEQSGDKTGDSHVGEVWVSEKRGVLYMICDSHHSMLDLAWAFFLYS